MKYGNLNVGRVYRETEGTKGCISSMNRVYINEVSKLSTYMKTPPNTVQQESLHNLRPSFNSLQNQRFKMTTIESNQFLFVFTINSDCKAYSYFSSRILLQYQNGFVLENNYVD